MHRLLRLRKNEDRRLRAGHLWVFANEVDNEATPLKEFEPGEPAVLETHNGHPLGTSYVNPHSLICARLVSRDAGAALDATLVAKRLERALALRKRLFDAPFYRLCYGESDGLPGLVVDRYGDLVVAQASTAGIERLSAEVEAALRDVVGPAAMLWRNDAEVRRLEGLEPGVRAAFGDVPEWLDLEEGGVTFRVSPLHGQKTGWFFDQRASRDRLQAYVAGARVLDLYSYSGAWALRAARAGAAEVTAVDTSQPALDQLAADADRNGLGERVETVCSDAAAAVKDLLAAGQRFDVVVLDPPAFIKRKKDLESGRAAYRRINELALQAVAEDGFLFSCSCSYHLGAGDLADILRRSARKTGRVLQLLETLGQSPDHPVHPAIPETRYLKGFVARVTGG